MATAHEPAATTTAEHADKPRRRVYKQRIHKKPVGRSREILMYVCPFCHSEKVLDIDGPSDDALMDCALALEMKLGEYLV